MREALDSGNNDCLIRKHEPRRNERSKDHEPPAGLEPPRKYNEL